MKYPKLLNHIAHSANGPSKFLQFRGEGAATPPAALYARYFLRAALKTLNGVINNHLTFYNLCLLSNTRRDSLLAIIRFPSLFTYGIKRHAWIRAGADILPGGPQAPQECTLRIFFLEFNTLIWPYLLSNKCFYFPN